MNSLRLISLIVLPAEINFVSFLGSNYTSPISIEKGETSYLFWSFIYWQHFRGLKVGLKGSFTSAGFSKLVFMHIFPLIVSLSVLWTANPKDWNKSFQMLATNPYLSDWAENFLHAPF